MTSFRPYRKPTNQVSVITSAHTSSRIHTVSENVENKIPKINYMERVLDDGRIVKLPVVNENAARALMANGFRRAYPAPGEESTLPTNPQQTQHVICRPAPLFPFIQELNPFTLATFLQPSPEDIARYKFYKQMQALRQPRQVTVEDYVKALALGNLNPLLSLSQMSEEEIKVPLPREKIHRIEQNSILEKIMSEAEQHAVNFDTMHRPSTNSLATVIQSTNKESD